VGNKDTDNRTMGGGWAIKTETTEQRMEDGH
jgi:hypothetical protein